MTREEASYILRKFYADGYKSNNYSNLEQALQLAVCYLENSPHWISVEDELPIDYEPVLAVVGGNHFAFVGICLNKKTWYCEIQNKATEIIGITHWCYLPQLPVLSNSEKTGKNHLIDANNMVEHLRETTKMIEKGGDQ